MTGILQEGEKEGQKTHISPFLKTTEDVCVVFIFEDLVNGHHNCASADTVDGQFKAVQRSTEQQRHVSSAKI